MKRDWSRSRGEVVKGPGNTADHVFWAYVGVPGLVGMYRYSPCYD